MTITWQRIPSPVVGEPALGYQAKGVDGLRIERHEVDDREYDGGYLATYWNLVVAHAPVDQYSTLSSAKRAAEAWYERSTK